MSASVEGTSLMRRAGSRRLAEGRGLVRRARLFDRLSSAGPGFVSLVCAPAGSGKSVLIRSWAEAEGLGDRLAWVSIERGERDGQRFWLSVINALADVAGSVERPTPSPSFSGDLIVERLLFELHELDEPVLLVIDDLHELHWLGRSSGWRLFWRTSRHGFRWCWHARGSASWSAPPAPDGAADRASEPLICGSRSTRRGSCCWRLGSAFRNRTSRFSYERTEAWLGLRLAAISLAQHPDAQRFVREFSGSERTVSGYLLAEVLERQPAEVREILLRTSVLDRVSGPLADFLTGGSGSERILQQLEDANAFVSSLDAGRTWFRYHHLFAELLQLELRRLAPAAVASLHRAAAEWFAQEQHFVEATRHAQAARDWSEASHLLADHFFDLALDGRIATVRDLLAVFPDDVAAADAELALVFAAVRLLSGEPGKEQRVCPACAAPGRRGCGGAPAALSAEPGSAEAGRGPLAR